MCLDLKLVGGKVVIFGDKQTNGQGALLYRYRPTLSTLLAPLSTLSTLNTRSYFVQFSTLTLSSSKRETLNIKIRK